ncbi:MAG: UDP-3-O-acyl-N-acetylglucosamine deacetylase [Candidatus Margulisbacteria bacterium]|nr:UDP-3-O-acyl-N-acetylglucosamine deacetylase [Candidatus Margulisiibacteriota bacterium]MBU1021995.1 UDP-3-O-acyl-N-acetylglucosamine deacetylase [Candidatus Margulisiibacteriota bacterium]MBU1728973.1 UDP-3-O-acyl-N-acetylglucosamine deacetylase [Candidatus Margulisiibacteriota bacterium]MBU1954779.1 UDP-3-O-acyl-N-acetylglucosamine deacetylase [Candidatus Margulisiibacteriota bacterium]
MRQKTIKEPESLYGIALHSGQNCKLSFLPAAENTGIVFKVGEITVPAQIGLVSSTIRGTTIEKDRQEVQLVEHILAACYGLGIDNLRIELSADEPPAADGSALPFVKVLKKAEVVEQDAEKKVFAVKNELKVESKEASIIALPYHGFKVSFMVDFPKIGEQFLEIEIKENTFVKELAPARTFGYLSEVEALKEQGLAKGASLDNALAIDENGYVNEPRFEDELVRHKILDVIGDLALLGGRIQAFIKCEKSGHALNIALAKKIAESL